MKGFKMDTFTEARTMLNRLMNEAPDFVQALEVIINVPEDVYKSMQNLIRVGTVESSPFRRILEIAYNDFLELPLPEKSNYFLFAVFLTQMKGRM